MQREVISNFLRDESGATSIEYALIAVIISICMVAGLTQISSSLQGTFNTIAPSLAGNR
jgi:pilus assembly protein Flp/PilA